MVMIQRQFSDASNLADGYELVYLDGIAYYKERTGNKGSRTSEVLNYSQDVNWQHAYETQADVLYEKMLISWGDACIQVRELFRELYQESEFAPQIKPTTKRAFTSVSGWLVQLFIADGSLSCPDVVPDGDGGVDIEWELDDQFVSVHIHNSNREQDKIYFKKNGEFHHSELTLENLLAVIKP